ncbi:probable serine/threonine-protein kinase SCO3848 [Palaemon carinicauda]|uniref:probable serine/threonine-protein kinase SCO3848 n=1 Tax=Palaemon carinicauda TaxID=392227 RepID=UPI0035B5FA51
MKIRSEENYVIGLPYAFLEKCIGEKLGRGAYGNVHALHGALEGLALKTFNAALIRKDDFEREVKIMQSLKDLKIPTIVAVCEAPYAIIMSKHEKTLAEWIYSERPTPKEVLDVAIQVALILKEMHSRNLCHNDLKEDNVMIDTTDNGKTAILIDFGLARPVGTIVFPLEPTKQNIATALEEHKAFEFYAPLLFVGGR